MKIIIEYLGETVTIETENNDPDSFTVPKITVPDDLKKSFDRALEFTPLYGHYGHSVDLKGACSNLDLQAAFHVQEFQRPTFPFKLISVEPPITPNPDFPPEGAVS